MPKNVKTGTCGWSRFPDKGDKLELYAKHFDVVEVNSTFYRLPRVSTAEKWLKKARGINDRFEFTVKAPKTITHEYKFREGSKAVWKEFLEIVKALESKVVIFQTPHKHFMPTAEHINNAKRFFSMIDRGDLTIGWEVRWKEEWTREIIEPLFEELDIIHVIDPLRQKPFRKQPFNYYRLHGFGERMMYDYKFSDDELREVKRVTKNGDYILFNNVYMYDDAMRFKSLF